MELWSHGLLTFTILCQKQERPDGEKIRKGVTRHIESSSGDQMDYLDWNSNHTKTTDSPGQLWRIDKYVLRYVMYLSTAETSGTEKNIFGGDV